jgi:hypothetical protein
LSLIHRLPGFRNSWLPLLHLAVACLAIAASGCNGGSSPANPPPPPRIAVSIAPTLATVQVGKGQQFTATVQNSSNTVVTWQVNSVAGGDSTHGILTPTDNTQLIDFIKREKRQKQHIRPSEVHGGYAETHKIMR